MQNTSESRAVPSAVLAAGEAPRFRAGEEVRVCVRYPIGHYRVPHYIRGRRAVVEAVIRPRAVDNEEEGFGRNAGSRRYYYRVAIAMRELWPEYGGDPADGLRIEVFESWLERCER